MNGIKSGVYPTGARAKMPACFLYRIGERGRVFRAGIKWCILGRGKGQGARVLSVSNRRLRTHAPFGELVSSRDTGQGAASFYAELIS